MLVLAGILLVLGTFIFVLSPFASGGGAPLADGPDLIAQLRELYALRDVAYETLRDLEFDFHAGKIGDADYRDLSDRTRREAVQIVQRIDALEPRIPHLPGRRRGRT